MKNTSHTELMLNIQLNGIHILPDIVHSCCSNFDVRGQFGCQNIKVQTPILTYVLILETDYSIHYILLLAHTSKLAIHNR